MAIDLYHSTATALFGGGGPTGIPILDPADPACRDTLFPRDVGYGHDPDQYVPDFAAAPDAMRLIPESEYDARYDEQERTQSSLEHLYLRGWEGENLDQGRDGYCWGYSTIHSVMLRRLATGLPWVRLNPHSLCSIIKNGRNEGGWCGLSLQFVREHGCAPEGTGPLQWPPRQNSVALNARFNDPAVKAEMARYRVTDDFYDLGKPAHGQRLKDQQRATLLFNNLPTPNDFNWWGHSVAALRLVRVEAGSWGVLILNSWKGWGRRGLAVLRGNQSRADGAVGIVSAALA